MKLYERWKNRRGETLIEALAAILIVALSSVVLLTGLGAASRLNLAAEEEHLRQCGELALSERQTGGGEDRRVVVTFSGEEIQAAVTVWGGADFASYRRAGGDG